ncbi:hypothetical protein [uncultured Tenacibaculum sp.]|nr:hypothetical protein [uncultured Tenacibaculum sp.]
MNSYQKWMEKQEDEAFLRMRKEAQEKWNEKEKETLKQEYENTTNN